VLKSIAGGVSGSIFDQLTKWWTDAYSSMTTAFSQAFLRAGDISISQLQSSPLWRLEVGVGATVAAGLMIWAGARSAWTHSGDPVAAAVVGAIKAVLSTAMVFVIVTALLGLADQLTQAVINAAAGDSSAFATKVGQLASLGGLTSASGALLFVFSVLGVLITAVLWAEMLIRAAGIVIVTVSTPVGAAGLVSPRTAGWWRKMVNAEIALIFLKPVVALVLAIGFTVSHDSTGIQGALVGFMVLGAAALAWPVVSRMLTFFEGQFAIGGMAAAWEMGRATAGRMGGGRSNGSQPLWQSMEQASSRPGGPGAGSALGAGGGAAEVAMAEVRPDATLGSAAGSVIGAAAAPGMKAAPAPSTPATGAPGATGATSAGIGGVVALGAAGALQTAGAAVAVTSHLMGGSAAAAGLEAGAAGATTGPEDLLTARALRPAGGDADGQADGGMGGG
jgi:hypothetical protein